MAASRQTIEKWFKAGLAQEASHMIVVCDTYDWTDYPVYVSQGQDPKGIKLHYNRAAMQRVMEVYNLNMDMEIQLNQYRSFNY
ncbi:MAG: hypothetical protein M0Q12_09430 [Synergistaceae bacterium]|jgi:hypothetical protein|nr:hypothetical protein [Synergistaceae bacterium]